MVPRRLHAALPALVLLGTVGLTACTSGSSGSSSSSGSATPSSAGTGSATASSAAGRPVAPSTLAALLQKGLSGATSAHLAVSTALAGQTLTGAGDVGLAQGAITRADLQQDLPSGLGSIRIVVVGGTTYAKLPSALAGSSGKPWVVLTTGSSSVVVSQLAATVQPVLAVASPATLVAFARSAASTTDLGPRTVGGTATTHYRVVVDRASLPTTGPSAIPSSITAGGGGSTIPVDLYLDAAGRPRQVTGTFTIVGQTATPTITLSDYNAPVSITAPPAGDVAGR